MKQTHITTNALRGILAAGLCLASIHTAQAALIFSNLPGGIGSPTVYLDFFATDFRTGPTSATITGASFTGYNHTSLSPFPPYGGFDVNLDYRVVPDNGGVPGTLTLASFSTTLTSASLSLQTFSFPTSFSLDANTTYWLVMNTNSESTGTQTGGTVMNAGPGGGGPASGVFSLLPATADKRYVFDPMSASFGWSDSYHSSPAFEFTGSISPIPEPGTAATGVLLFGAALLKRRRHHPSKSPLLQGS